MKCLICENTFMIKRTLNTLFKKEKYYICKKCYQKYKIDINILNIEVDNVDIIIFSLFKERFIMYKDPFILEYSKVFEHIYNTYNNHVILLYNSLKINTYTIDKLKNVLKLSNNKLVILTYFVEIE